LLLLFGKRVGVAGRNRPAEVGGEGRALSTAAREETSSPQKNAYRVPGLRFTQRTGDMVYIGLENLLPLPPYADVQFDLFDALGRNSHLYIFGFSPRPNASHSAA